MNSLSKETRHLIRKALREDIGMRDVTTDLFVPSSLYGKASIVLKSKGTLCGGLIAKEVFLSVDPTLKVKQTVKEGSQISKLRKIMEIKGRLASILKAERTALNFLGHLSGVATLTYQFVQKIKGTRAHIYDTRKTTPLWRVLEKYAVRIGGGRNHRFGLFDEILVKDNHWEAMMPLLQKTKCRYFFDRLKKLKNSRIPIEIEVDNVKELKHLLDCKKGTGLINSQRPVPFLAINRILLDNFSISDLKKAVSEIRAFSRKIEIEASGGIHLSNVNQVAKTGVDRISIGALTHSAPSVDFSLEIES